MPLIRRDGALAQDRFSLVADDAALPEGEPVIVSLARFKAEREHLDVRNAPLGIRLKSHESPLEIARDAQRFALIEIEFPGFRDGRGFSYARRLRTQLGFTGELRAVGTLLPDQAQFLVRCGFDTIALKDGTPLAPWQRGLEEMTVWYQAASDRRPTAALLRQRRAAE